jgi:hypothetical protein
MTIKELAEFTGKTEKTIQRWVAKRNDKMTLNKDIIALVKGKETNLTIDQVESILNAGSMSKDAVNILMSNARQPKDIIAQPTPLEVSLIKMVEQNNKIMSMMMIKLESMDNSSVFEQPKQLSLPSAPDIKPRAYLNQLVREYSQLKDVDFQKGWNVLYTEILYRCKENIKVKAKNEGIKPIDYLEREGKLLVACSIMKELT